MQKKTDLEQLIGVWKLVSSTKTFPDGRALQVYNDNPKGYIIFTPVKIMSVQIMRRNRTGFDGDNLLKDYLAYTGNFEIDEVDKIVTFEVETSLSADFFDKTLKRKYQFDKNLLKLKALEAEIDHVITWERVGA